MDMTLRILLAVAILVLAGCASVGPHADDTAWRDARQLVLVTTADREATTGPLRTFARGDDGAWHEAGKAAPVSIGRGGNRKSVGEGKRGSGRVDLGWRRQHKKKKKTQTQ